MHFHVEQNSQDDGVACGGAMGSGYERLKVGFREREREREAIEMGKKNYFRCSIWVCTILLRALALGVPKMKKI